MTKILEFVSEPSGRLSHTKAQSLGAWIVLTSMLILHVAREGLSVEMTLAYGGLFVIGRAASKFAEVRK